MNSRPVVLFIVHPWGGGTTRFASELADLISDRVDVVWAWGVENKTLYISKRRPYFTEQSFDLAAGLDAPLHALTAFKPSRVNIIHTIGLQRYIAAPIERFAVPYDVTFTDYHHFSERPHFENDSGCFIGDAVVAPIAHTARDSISPLLRRAERHRGVRGLGAPDWAIHAGISGDPRTHFAIGIGRPTMSTPCGECSGMKRPKSMS